MGHHPLKSAASALLWLALGGCSATPEHKQEPPVTKRTFSDEDKRVARALSVGSEIQTGNVTPQYEAQLCSLALGAIAERLRDSGSLSAQQLEGFERARNVFRQRAATGLSPEEREKTRNDVEAAYPDQSDRARVAIGCLRKLA